MKFDSAGTVEEVVWTMRLADLPRGENRAIITRLFNGEPPFDPDKAEENSVQINRNFLQGPNLMLQGRSRWNQAMLKQANYFGVSLDSGPVYKRQEWSATITQAINHQLKGCKAQMEGIRAEGANVLLHGIAPSSPVDRRNPIFKPMPVSSLMIPSETDIDFENLEYFAIFREWTPSQLYSMTHGPKVDPGWNMDAVNMQWNYIREQLQKEPNSTAYQYMPERIEELIKQDMGYWGTDAVPTVDVWDFYFREAKDGDGWYRRIFLDWGVAPDQSTKTGKPDSRNTRKEKGGFLYTSGKRKFAGALSEILQCQFGDCSAVAPFKYHSVRSMGWMLWGICDLENRLRCRFTESVFEQLLWFFRTSSQQDFQRIKKAMFTHMGVIPQGINFVTANERFKPDVGLIEMAFAGNRELMNQSAGSFMGSPDDLGKEETATGTMARVHSVNAMMGGILTLAYEYAKFKYMEQARRFCIKNSPYKMVRDFRMTCLQGGVPEEMLDSSRWQVEPDRALGDGNKVLEMAIAQGLQGIRKNLTPDAQRKVDHRYIVSLTDRPDLAEDLAPIQGQKKLTPSTHDAQLATERILRGLQYTPSPEMVPEDYVLQWLTDLATLVQQAQAGGNSVTMEKVTGMANLGQHIGSFLKVMEGNAQGGKHDHEEKAKLRQYSDALGKLMNLVKAFAQRAQEQQGKNGQAQPEIAKIQLDEMKTKAKVQQGQQSHSIKTAQRQASFELEESRKDRETAAEIRREDARTAQELVHKRLKSFQE